MDITDYLLIAVLIAVVISIFKKNKNNSIEDERLIKVEDKLSSFDSSVNEKLININKDVTKEVAVAMTQINEKLGSVNKDFVFLKEAQDNFNKILGGSKQFGGVSEFSLKAIVSDSLPVSMYVENKKLNLETGNFVEIAIKLPTDVYLPIDSHWPMERFNEVQEALKTNDKIQIKKARESLASAMRRKAEEVKEKYINPPISTPFAFVYVPTEGLYNELVNYSDAKTKELLTQELYKKFQVTIVGPNTLFQSIQAFNIGFQTLRIQKNALQIYDDLKGLQTRFSKHFSNIANVSKKLEDTMAEVNKFGTDARVISRALENIKDPEQPERAIVSEDNQRIENQSKQLKN